MRAVEVGKGLLQFVLFQGAWFACVVGAARSQPAIGIAAVAATVAVTMGISRHRAVELAMVAAAVLLGLMWDTAMLRAGLLVYASPGPFAGLAPGWILALWALFATLLCGPLSWLHGRPVLAALLGAVGGPLSYLAAVRLGAGSFPQTEAALLTLAVGWAVMTPGLCEAARWLVARARAAEA